MLLGQGAGLHSQAPYGGKRLQFFGRHVGNALSDDCIRHAAFIAYAPYRVCDVGTSMEQLAAAIAIPAGRRVPCGNGRIKHAIHQRAPIGVLPHSQRVFVALALR